MLLDLIDVFAGVPLGGNPLAVVRGTPDKMAALDTAGMQRMTDWLGFSETTFLLPPSDPQADYRVRIFCPGRELAFAGHPTLGSARAWLAAGGVAKRAGVVVQECGIGLVEVRVDAAAEGERLAFRAPPLRRSGPLSAAERAEAAQRAGVDPRVILDAVHADNGPEWVLLRLRSAADVLAARPEARAPVPCDIGLVGPHAVGEAEEWPADWEVRAFFADGAGRLKEDPVTGSLNAGIALYLYGAGLATADYVAAQGRCVGATGRIHVSRDDDGAAWIGGVARVVARNAAVG